MGNMTCRYPCMDSVQSQAPDSAQAYALLDQALWKVSVCSIPESKGISQKSIIKYRVRSYDGCMSRGAAEPGTPVAFCTHWL